MSIFKDSFKQEIRDQLKTRQEAIYNRTPKDIQYYNARNSWIRMTSSVDVNGDKGALASKNILQGGMNVTPDGFGWTSGYLTGDAHAPNGLPVTAGVSFPLDAVAGDYALRLDYFPNRMFRYDGKRWYKISENVRTDLNNGPTNDTLRSSFVNNTYTVPTTAILILILLMGLINSLMSCTSSRVVYRVNDKTWKTASKTSEMTGIAFNK